MADINPAKARDTITLKARKKMCSMMSCRDLDPNKLQLKVLPKAPGNQGQWICITCGFPASNNLEACSHMDDNKLHKFAWRNFETGNIEEP